MTTISSTHAVGVAEAKKRFSDLLGRVAYGHERIAILRRGKPMAYLVPALESAEGLGSVKGWLSSQDPFFHHIQDVVKKRKNLLPRPVKFSR